MGFTLSAEFDWYWIFGNFGTECSASAWSLWFYWTLFFCVQRITNFWQSSIFTKKGVPINLCFADVRTVNHFEVPPCTPQMTCFMVRNLCYDLPHENHANKLLIHHPDAFNFELWNRFRINDHLYFAIITIATAQPKISKRRQMLDKRLNQ